MIQKNVAVLGAGNIGMAIASGLLDSGLFEPSQLYLTRRHLKPLNAFAEQACHVLSDNTEAVRKSDILLICVEPGQVDGLLDEIKPVLDPEKHVVMSVVTGLTIATMREKLGDEIPVVRAMPNTAIAIRESMTSLSFGDDDPKVIEMTRSIFDTVGKTLVIAEEQMISATALGACGIAFFLRAIRAASQGGIEIGFHSEDALAMAAQVAKGAASLLLNKDHHPEYEIDKVTTPRGCTISGLNQMEHEGFSSAMIKGITTSAEKAAKLY